MYVSANSGNQGGNLQSVLNNITNVRHYKRILKSVYTLPANKRCWLNVGLMLVQRLRDDGKAVNQHSLNITWFLLWCNLGTADTIEHCGEVNY